MLMYILGLALDSGSVYTHMYWAGKSFRETFNARGVNTQALQWDQVGKVFCVRVDLCGGRRPFNP